MDSNKKHGADCACYACTFRRQVLRERENEKLFDKQLELRLPPSKTPHPGVNWNFIDPWLRVLKGRGALAFLSREAGIHPNTLQARRRALGMPPLPKGRPTAKFLTSREVAVLQARESGDSQGQIAMKLGISQQSVNQSLQSAKAKEGRYCVKCKGAGVLVCTHNCVFSGGHFHLCDGCGGESSYAAEPPKKFTEDAQ